jgi:xanthine dehydrogenase accessory factor
MSAATSAAQILVETGRRIAAGRSVAICTLARCEGSTPGKPGWRALIDDQGLSVGNLGGGAFEALALHDARRLLEAGRAVALVKRYYLTEQARRGEATGMVCGGFVEVLIEVVGVSPRLLIFGAGPVGRAIAAAGALAGFELSVSDDRPDLLDPAAFPQGTHLVAPNALTLGPHADTAVAVVTRCWETDLAALRLVAAATPWLPAYLGLMGSRRKIERIKQELLQEGIDPLALGLRAPIGLPIGGDSPGEIAIGVLAEIIAARTGRATGDQVPTRKAPI